MDKQAYLEETYNSAFNDELDKLAAAGLVGAGLKVLKKSFKNLKSGLVHQGGHAKKLITTGTSKQKKQRLKDMGRSALTTARKSKASLAVGSSAAAGSAYALSD